MNFFALYLIKFWTAINPQKSAQSCSMGSLKINISQKEQQNLNLCEEYATHRPRQIWLLHNTLRKVSWLLELSLKYCVLYSIKLLFPFYLSQSEINLNSFKSHSFDYYYRSFVEKHIMKAEARTALHFKLIPINQINCD